MLGCGAPDRNEEKSNREGETGEEKMRQGPREKEGEGYTAYLVLNFSFMPSFLHSLALGCPQA